ncbi:MAG: SDR family oxidoreductase [Bryobacterales bacterium]|nr:SDR family oxidoreductase [Bryobacterales bacterium]
MDTLKGAVTLVTGAGRGLGAAICEVLSEAGAVICAADICAQPAADLAAALPRNGAEHMAAALDVGDESQVERTLQRILDRYGRLDVVVNNAGVDLTAPVDEMPVSEWDRILATNLRGPFLTARLAFPVMKRGGGGQIVNIVSTAARRAWANAAAYHASKFGLLGLSHALHVEGRRHNIKVTAVISGGMRTPFLLERFPDIDSSTLQDPHNVARTVLFVLRQPAESVIPEVMVLPMRETSWP